MIRYVSLGIVLTGMIITIQLLPEQQLKSKQVLALEEVTRSSQGDARPASAPKKPVDDSDQVRKPAIRATDKEIIRSTVPDPMLDVKMYASSPWIENDNPPLVPQRYQRQGIEVRALKMDNNQLSRLRSGDQLILPIPQLNTSYQMQVDVVGRHPNGDKSLKGHLVNTAKRYSVVMTRGENATFATINTPNGSFMLEAAGDDGWIMSLAELDYMIDPNLDDSRIPDITR